jgi:hypothetical protein
LRKPNSKWQFRTCLPLVGTFIQNLEKVDADDARLMTSQVSMSGKSPPQIKSLEKPLIKKHLR